MTKKVAFDYRHCQSYEQPNLHEYKKEYKKRCFCWDGKGQCKVLFFNMAGAKRNGTSPLLTLYTTGSTLYIEQI